MAKTRGFGSFDVKKGKNGKKRYFPFYMYNMARHRAGRGFDTKMAAEAWLSNEKKLIDLGEWTPPAQRRKKAEVDPLTVGEWIEEFRGKLEGRLKASTISKYADIENYRILDVQAPADKITDITRLKDIPLVELTKNDVYRWWDAISAHWNDEGKVFNQKAYVRLRAACAEAVRREMIPSNPVDIPEAARKIKTKEKYLMEDWEPRKLIEKSPDRYKAVTLLTLHHGLRIGEALALTLGDVTITPAKGDTPARAQVSITKNYQYLPGKDSREFSMQLMDTPKTEAGNRVVDIFVEDVPKLAACVARRKAEGANSTDLLTVAIRGGALTPNKYRSELEKIKKTAGVSKKIHPHCGRYWLITRLSERGVTIKAIGEILGQTDLKTITEIYMRVSPGATREAMQGLGKDLQEEEKKAKEEEKKKAKEEEKKKAKEREENKAKEEEGGE